ncbi:MAG: hypothetical protein A2V98_10425 [Planctomycetes bacterium RBG_16_64_12]|nr:MAG: hypothetical protein A2V98_10425 [Planctomycetes bacterium RBG_16_64_12]
MKFVSPVYSDAWGKIAGLVYARNRFGMYTRALVTPVNPQSSEQQQVRNALAAMNARWTETLTAAQRAAWEAYALAVPKVSHGQSLTLTGQNWFIACNTPRVQCDAAISPTTLPIIDDAPTLFNQAQSFPVAITRNAATQNWDCAFDNTQDWASEAGAAIIIRQSRGTNASRNFFKGPYRLMNRVAGAGTPPASPKVFAAVFPIVSGLRYFFESRLVRADGRISSPFQTSALIA